MNKKRPILIQFKNKTHAMRIQKGLPQEQLAHLANIQRTYIGIIQRAERNITPIHIQKIANTLNSNLIDLSKND
jgi:transcriptional regulator with XRE-family HTH domain